MTLQHAVTIRGLVDITMVAVAHVECCLDASRVSQQEVVDTVVLLSSEHG
jgi:hypothetical protein